MPSGVPPCVSATSRVRLAPHWRPWQGPIPARVAIFTPSGPRCVRPRSDSGTKDGGNNYNGDAEINAPIIKRRLAIRAVVGYQNLSGWISTPNQRDANDELSRTGRLKILGRPTDDLSIEAEVWLSRDSFGGLSSGYTDYRNAALINQSYYNNYNAYGLKTKYNFTAFTITSHTSYLNYTSAGTIDPYFLLHGLHLPEPLAFNSHVFTQEIDLASNQAGPWKWTGGAVFRNATDNDFIAVIPLLTYDWTNTSRSYAVFGELSRKFYHDKLELTLGARYFHDDVGTRSQRPRSSPCSHNPSQPHI